MKAFAPSHLGPSSRRTADYFFFPLIACSRNAVIDTLLATSS
jgi:hypothetical protein